MLIIYVNTINKGESSHKFDFNRKNVSQIRMKDESRNYDYKRSDKL